MSKGNSKDFNDVICGGFTQSNIDFYSTLSSDEYLKRSYSDERYLTDYRRAILHYYKACGCKILDTNNNWWNDRFYVYATLPKKAVDPVTWFDETYKDGIYWSKSKKFLLCNLIILFFLLTIIYLNSLGY